MRPGPARLAGILGIALLLIACIPPAGPAASAEKADCGAALSAPGLRWDGDALEPYTWSATEEGIEKLDSFGGQPVAVCVATGPTDRLPLQNRIGCLLIGASVARTTDDKLMCGAFLSLEQQGPNLRWIAHSSAATAAVTGFLWNGSRFALNVPTYEACKDALSDPVQDPRLCGSA
jgi:hypothetical protein